MTAADIVQGVKLFGLIFLASCGLLGIIWIVFSWRPK
jgi:hypothetical protein